MKKVLLIIALVTVTFCFANKAAAKGIPIPFSYNAEKLFTALDLPNDSTTVENVSGTETYVNIGYYYKQVSILWIPLWNYDESYCIVYEGIKDYYANLMSKDEANGVAEIYKLQISKTHIPFWDRIGGKLVVLALIAFIVWGYTGKKRG